MPNFKIWSVFFIFMFVYSKHYSKTFRGFYRHEATIRILYSRIRLKARVEYHSIIVIA